MFVFGFLLGLGVAAGIVWLLIHLARPYATEELAVLQARRQIGELERATIHRMLEEAQAASRDVAGATTTAARPLPRRGDRS